MVYMRSCSFGKIESGIEIWKLTNDGFGASASVLDAFLLYSFLKFSPLAIKICTGIANVFAENSLSVIL